LITKTNFAELHRQVAFGKSGGKIIWQPRIGCWVEDKRFTGEGLPMPYTNMDYPEIYRHLNCSARIYEFNYCFESVEHASVIKTERKLNDKDTEITIQTPVGKQIMVNRNTGTSRLPLHLKWEISNEEELKVAIWRTENTDWRWNQNKYEQLLEEWDNLGAPTMFMPRVNVQDLYINKMGTEKAIYAIYDWPDTVDAYFKALDKCHNRLIDIINESPVEIINFGDNVHAGTLPPDLFIHYVLPAYQNRCEKLHKGGKFVHAHWDGDTKSLLPYAQDTGLDGIEAITPKPQGDVTLEDIKTALGDKLFLIDGLPAILFDDIYSVSELREFTHRLIDMFAPKLILGISDEISSTGDIERIKIVAEIVEQYNSKLTCV